jgi:G3E family GTPase
VSIPVTLITGFLGSGKTTVLNRLLKQPDLADTVAIINEFGEIGLDHLLVERSDETLTLLNNGCLCCTVRGDLVATLGDLAARRGAGTIRPYSRVVVETTGLADPAPILHTLMTEPTVTAHHRLEGVVTAVDGVNGLATLEAHAEAVKQAAVADRILLTKGDIAPVDGQPALVRRLRELNRGTRIIPVTDGAVDPATIFSIGPYDADGKIADVRAWQNAEAAADDDQDGHDAHHHHHHHHDVNRHDARVRAYCVTIEEPVAWDAFAQWLELMAALRGEQMLRVKGLVAIAEAPERPMVVHGVQHIFHPPVKLDAWPSADRRTRLVFITRDLPRETIDSTLRKFGGVAAVIS